MREWPDFEVYRERSRDLLREAEEVRLASEARKGAAGKKRGVPLQSGESARVRVRWGSVEDETGIVELLDLNGMPRWIAFEERFIVAVEDGVVRAALRYRTESKRLILGLLVVDPWAGERRFARSLYAGARDLGRELCVGEVLAARVSRTDYPREAGYRRHGRGWRLDVARSVGSTEVGNRSRYPAAFLKGFAEMFLRRRGWR